MNRSADTSGPLATHKALLDRLRTTGACGLDLSNVTPLHKAAVADSAADGPSRTRVLDARRHVVAVLAISSHVDSEQVALSLAKAKGAREMLGPDLGNVILEPLAEGSYEGLSYALWPWRRNLSDSRVVAFVQKRTARPRLLGWLREATAVTLRPVPEDHRASAYRRALEALERNEDMPEALRHAASSALRRLDNGTWHPVSVLEHGDFWLGNVLFPRLCCLRGAHTRGFVLIDWAGARLHGYPFFDLLRLALSSSLSPVRLRKEVLIHCASLGCDSTDAFSYLAAGLGATGLELGHFPPERYHAMARAAYRCLENALR